MKNKSIFYFFLLSIFSFVFLYFLKSDLFSFVSEFVYENDFIIKFFFGINYEPSFVFFLVLIFWLILWYNISIFLDSTSLFPYNISYLISFLILMFMNIGGFFKKFFQIIDLFSLVVYDLIYSSLGEFFKSSFFKLVNFTPNLVNNSVELNATNFSSLSESASYSSPIGFFTFLLLFAISFLIVVLIVWIFSGGSNMFKSYSRNQAKRISENSDKNFSKLTKMLDRFFGTVPTPSKENSPGKKAFPLVPEYTEEEIDNLDFGKRNNDSKK